MTVHGSEKYGYAELGELLKDSWVYLKTGTTMCYFNIDVKSIIG